MIISKCKILTIAPIHAGKKPSYIKISKLNQFPKPRKIMSLFKVEIKTHA